MKTKFKDFLLYSLACVGAVSLFLSAYQPQQTTSTVPESHVWEFYLSEGSNAGIGSAFSLNKVTGEVRKYNTSSDVSVAKDLVLSTKSTSSYTVMVERNLKK